MTSLWQADYNLTKMVSMVPSRAAQFPSRPEAGWSKDVMIRIKRVYDSARPEDGLRILVDRLWPRGIGKNKLRLDSWYKGVAPSSDLRKWFSHDPARWDEFKRLYFAELDSNPTAWSSLAELARRSNVTLLYSARDEEHNNAEALRDYLQSKI
jgi:uncharacterized protein YeaO (DUF488 family)